MISIPIRGRLGPLPTDSVAKPSPRPQTSTSVTMYVMNGVPEQWLRVISYENLPGRPHPADALGA